MSGRATERAVPRTEEPLDVRKSFLISLRSPAGYSSRPLYLIVYRLSLAFASADWELFRAVIEIARYVPALLSTEPLSSSPLRIHSESRFSRCIGSNASFESLQKIDAPAR